jgi:hypothetical protein
MKTIVAIIVGALPFLAVSCQPEVVETHEVIVVKPKPKPKHKPAPDNPESFRAVGTQN